MDTQNTNASEVIRVMTYNVHRCKGTDGIVSTKRIADVIDQYRPDIIALQELEVITNGREHIHQAQEIAGFLEMDYRFYPSMQRQEGEYGNAILSRFPIHIVKTEILPKIKGEIRLTRLEKIFKNAFEPRGVLWAQIKTDRTTCQVVTTHLGLTNHGRKVQMDRLLGAEWLGSPECREPVIFLGDLNDTHRSPQYRRILDRQFTDAQQDTGRFRRKPTFFSFLPLRCLDHIFVKGQTTIRQCHVPKTPLTVKASDHLPVVADIVL